MYIREVSLYKSQQPSRSKTTGLRLRDLRALKVGGLGLKAVGSMQRTNTPSPVFADHMLIHSPVSEIVV